MEEQVKYIIDEAIEGREQNGEFIIDTDEKAEWALKKIAQEKLECERMKAVCEQMIETYKRKVEDAQTRFESKTSYLKGMLQRYIETVKTKDSKTQKTYALPSGKLKIKFQKPDFTRDDETLTKWLKKNGYNDFIKTEEKIQWGEFKKVIDIKKDAIVDEETGELIDYTPFYVIDTKGNKVDGITVVERDPVFEVEVET
jgi:phage host-nuclease inhibitor protein Gam